jgi:hypothetical protein
VESLNLEFSHARVFVDVQLLMCEILLARYWL